MGIGPRDLLPASVFWGVCAAEVAASLPVSGLAGFGAYEGAWTIAFYNLGLTKELAAMTGVAHHLFTQVYGYSIGVLALLVLLLPWCELPQTQHGRLARCC